MQSLYLPQSGAWLSVAPISALGYIYLLMSSVLLSKTVGVKNCTRTRENSLFCKPGTVNVMGDYAVSCHDRDDIISPHNRVRDKIISACTGALLFLIYEQKRLLPDNSSRPGDMIYLECRSISSFRPFSVTSHLPSSIIVNASEETGFALSAAEDKKYEQRARNVVKSEFNSFLWLSKRWEDF